MSYMKIRQSHPSNIKRKLPLLSAVATFMVVPLAIGSAYTSSVLYPLTPPAGIINFSSNSLEGAAGGQVIGFGLGPSSSDHAILWSNVPKSVVDLTPPGFDDSIVYGTDGSQQVGEGSAASTGNNDHALLWSGSAGSAIDLNPRGFTASTAYGTNGSQQVGSGGATGAFTYFGALLWSGTAASAVKLNPAGFATSQAYATDGSQQVGWGTNNGIDHAMLWSGSAASAVDLNPSGFTTSQADSVSGNQEVGYGGFSFTNTALQHALLWYGTPASAVDLNPAGITTSEASGTNGVQQVGFGFEPGDVVALVWSGTSDSVVNLNPLLPSNRTWLGAQALSIDPSGNIYGVAADSFSNLYAVEWSPVPEPKAVSLLLFAGAGTLMHRKRKQLA
jgi:hypothetical protein